MTTNGNALQAIAQVISRETGWNSSIEYPGFIAIPRPDGIWSIGTAGDTWAGDLTDAEGAVVAGFETEIPCTVIDAELLGRLIAYYIRERAY